MSGNWNEGVLEFDSLVCYDDSSGKNQHKNHIKIGIVKSIDHSG